MKKSSTVAIVILLSSLSIARLTGAEPLECNGKFEDPVYRQVTNSILRWEGSSHVTLSAGARAVVLQNYCQASHSIVEEGKLSVADIDAASLTIISDYLEPQLSDQSLRSMGAIIRSRILKASGLARPQIKPLGVLLIKYSAEKNPDAVFIENEKRTRLGTEQRFMIPVGRLEITGVRNGKTVCKNPIELKPSVEEKIEC